MVFLDLVQGVIYDYTTLAGVIAILGLIGSIFWNGPSLKKGFQLAGGLIFGGGLGIFFLKQGAQYLDPLTGALPGGGGTTGLPGGFGGGTPSAFMQLHAAFTEIAIFMILFGVMVLLVTGIVGFLRNARIPFRGGGGAPGAPGAPPQPPAFSIFGRMTSGNMPIARTANPRITDIDNGRRFDANDTGNYEIPNLAAATYRLQAEADGYDPSPITPVRLSNWTKRRRQDFPLTRSGLRLEVTPARNAANVTERIQVTVRARRGSINAGGVRINLRVEDPAGIAAPTINGRAPATTVTTDAATGEARFEVGSNLTGGVDILADIDPAAADTLRETVEFLNPGDFILGVDAIADVDEGDTFTIRATSNLDLATTEDVQARIMRGGTRVRDWFELTRQNARTFRELDIPTEDWEPGTYTVNVRAERQGVRRLVSTTFDVDIVRPDVTLVDPPNVPAFAPGGEIEIRVEGLHLRGVNLIRLVERGNAANTRFVFRGRNVENVAPAGGSPRHLILRMGDRDSVTTPIVDGDYDVVVVRGPMTSALSAASNLTIDGTCAEVNVKVQNRAPPNVAVGGAHVWWGAVPPPGPPLLTNPMTGRCTLTIPYALLALPRGEMIHAEHVDFIAGQTRRIILIPGGYNADQLIELDKVPTDGIVQGFVHVVGNPANRVAGVRVTWGAAAGGPHFAITDAAGNYSFIVRAGDLGAHPFWVDGNAPVVPAGAQVVHGSPPPNNYNIAVPPPPVGGSITGKITLQGTGAPLAGVSVVWNGHPAVGAPPVISDAGGNYAIPGIPAAECVAPGHPLVATLAGHEQVTPVLGAHVRVNPGPAPTNVDIVMKLGGAPPPGAATLFGTVTNKAGAVLGGVQVQWGATPTPFIANTNAAGYYEILVNMPSAKKVYAQKAGHSDYDSPNPVKLKPGDRTEHSFQMLDPGDIADSYTLKMIEFKLRGTKKHAGKDYFEITPGTITPREFEFVYDPKPKGGKVIKRFIRARFLKENGVPTPNIYAPIQKLKGGVVVDDRLVGYNPSHADPSRPTAIDIGQNWQEVEFTGNKFPIYVRVRAHDTNGNDGDTFKVVIETSKDGAANKTIEPTTGVPEMREMLFMINKKAPGAGRSRKRKVI